MKILVTGTAGFIGSNLSEYLLDKGYEVVGVDNFNDWYNPKIKEYNIKGFKDRKNFSLYRIDILDKKALTNVFKKENIDVIVHLAAWAGVTDSVKFPAEYVRNNIEGTVNLAELAVKNNINNFIFASTSSIYGDNKTPFTENMNTDLPLAPYPASKKACEVMLYPYSRIYGLNVTILRIFNPLGIHARPDLALAQLFRSCAFGTIFNQYQDSDSTARDYVYLPHIFESIQYIFENPQKYEIFNVGNSSPVSLGKLIKTTEKITGKKANIKRAPERYGEMKLTYANIDKARKMINYNPTTSLEEAVNIYYNWFMQQEDWYKKGDY